MTHETAHRMGPPAHSDKDGHTGTMNPYALLAVMAGLHFVAMYGLMYAMVDTWGNVFNNLNQVYMAAMMTAPMVALEILLMRQMYPRMRVNIAVVATSAAVLVLFFTFTRLQAGIGNEQFLRSMIPHHAGAILMCGEATISDPEIATLCQSIIAGQQAEIDQMKAILTGLERETP